MARRLIHVLHPNDNVATALADLPPGTVVESEAAGDRPAQQITARSAISFGHKLALTPIARGEPVMKYGEVIGLATQDIASGDHVHIHNVESQRGRGDLVAKSVG